MAAKLIRVGTCGWRKARKAVIGAAFFHTLFMIPSITERNRGNPLDGVDYTAAMV
jgi:hypothetical protein